RSATPRRIPPGRSRVTRRARASLGRTPPYARAKLRSARRPRPRAPPSRGPRSAAHDPARSGRRRQMLPRRGETAADILRLQPERLADPLEREAPGAIAAAEPARGLPTEAQGRLRLAVDLDRVLQDRQREPVLAAERRG